MGLARMASETDPKRVAPMIAELARWAPSLAQHVLDLRRDLAYWKRLGVRELEKNFADVIRAELGKGIHRGVMVDRRLERVRRRVVADFDAYRDL